MCDNILVAVRLRPLIEREMTFGNPICWKVENSNDVYQIDPQTKKISEHSSSVFKFDHVFDMKATNMDVYEKVTKPLVDSAVNGFNATIFAYGQTSSGKTHTMMGSKTERGVLELVVNEIFEAIESNPDREYLLRVSFIEIYQEQITDLLTGSTRLKVSDTHNEVVIKELSEEMCSTPDSVIDVMKKGEKLRHIACTNMNERSSRSHTIFRIIIESRSRCETSSDEIAIQLSHLNLVDLAGSEKVDQTGATGGRFKEGCAINVSLSALGKVIDQLSKNERHVNFRDNKLTHILRNSLGGNARTAIICAISPASVDETLSTLRFATGAKTIMNKPVVNEVVNDKAMLKRYEKKIKDLQLQLQSGSNLNQSTVMLDVSALIEEKDRMIRELKEKLIVSTHDPTPKGWNATELERANRRKTWCPSSSKNLKRLSFELPRADRSLNIQTPTSLHEESFDSRQFQLECLLEEDEDKSQILTPEDMQDRGRHSYNKDMGKMDMSVQTSFTENPTDTPSAKTPVSRVLSKSVGTPASELRAQMRSLIRRIKSIQEEYSLLENHYEELNKDYKELQEFTKFEKDFGVRDKWEKEQKLKIKDQLDLASEEIQSLEKNNDDLEQVVNDLQLQIDWERERNSRVMTSLQEETIKPLVTENTDLKKTIKEAKVKLTILEKEKNDQCIGFEIAKHNMERQIMELRASLEEAWGSSKSEQAPTGKELQLKLVLLQEEHKTTNEKLSNQESTYKTDIESLRNQLSVKESQILEEIAARQSAEALTKQLQLELQGYTERISSASRGTKRISCSPIREDTSVNKSLKQVQKKLKLEDSFDESTLLNLEGDKNFEHFPYNEFEQLKEKLEAQNELLKQQIEEREKAEKLIKDLNEDLSLQKAVETELKETLWNELEQLKEELEAQKELSKQKIEEREKAEKLINDLNEDLSLQKAVETERKETLCRELEQLKEELEVQKELSKQKIEEREKAEKLIKDLNENLSLQKTVETELKETLCSELEQLKEELVAQKELLKQQTEEREKAEKLIKDLNKDLSFQKAVETKLKETLETVSDEYEKLRSEIKSREARIELITKANKELNENLRNMKEDNEHRETTQDNLRTDIELFDQEKLISKNRLSVLEKEKKELEQTIEGLTEEMKISESEKNTLRLSLENYQTEVKCLKERVDDHASVVSKMQQDLDKHQNDKLNLEKRIDSLESELNKRQKEIENLLENLEMEKNGTLSLKQLLETANIEKKEIEVSMEQHILKSTQLQQDIDSLLCEKSNFEAKLKLLEAEEIEKQKKIEASLKELEVERDHVSKLQFEKNDTLEIKKSLETMSIEKQTLEKLIEDQDLVVSSLKKDIDLLQCQKEQLEKEKGALQCEQKETQERVDLLQCQKEQLEKEKGELQFEQQETQKRVELLLEDLEIERTDSGVIRQEIEELRLEMDKMKDDLADKEMRANRESHRGTDGEDKLEAVTAERDSLFTQLSGMMQKLQSLQEIKGKDDDICNERSRGNLSSTPARRPLGLFMKGKVEDTSMAGLGVSFLDDDKSFSVIEATSFSIAETLSSNEIEVVKNQLAVLQGVIKEDQEKYNLTIQEKEEIIHTLSGKIVDLEKNLLDLKNLFEESKSQIKVLESDTQTISHEKDVLEKQLSETTSLVVEISEEIKNTKTSSESSTKLAQDRLTEIENLKKEIALTHCQFEETVELKERINTLQEELKSAKEASDAVMCPVADYETKIKELQQEKEMSEEYKKIIQEKEDAIYNLSSKLADSEKNLLDSKNHYEESKSQIEVLESDIKIISHEKDVLEKHLNEKTRLFVEISEEIKHTKISSESLTKLAEDRLTEIEKLKKEIALTHCHFEETKDLKERINTLKEELVSAKEASDTAMCLVADYETEIEEVKQSYEKEMSEKTSRINLLEDLTEKLEDEVKSYTEKLISKNEEVKCLQLSLESLKRTNESNQSAMEEVTELQSKLNERTSYIKVLEVNINALQSKLDEAYSDKDVATKNHQQIIEEEQEKSREAMTKIAELEGYVSSLQTEIRDLGIHKEGLEEELKTLRDNLNEKEGLINEQKKLLASLNGHISELEANQTVLNEQVREIELLKNSLNETAAQLSEARANIKDDVKNEEPKICLANLKNEVVMFKANSQTLQEENEQLLASVQEKQKLSDDQKESINHLKIQISDMEGQLQIQISSAENEKLNEAISKGNEEILSLRKELTAIQDEKEQELLRFVECEKDFQMKLDAKIAEAESLQVKIGELAVKNCQFQELTKTLEETTTLYKALQDDKIELIMEVEKLQSKLTESNSSAIEMRKTIEEKLAVITLLSEERKMLATENDQLKSQISDKTSIVEQLKKALEETRNELITVESDMSSKLKEFENLSRHHADEINKKENELAQVTKEKEVVEDLLARTKEEIQLLKSSQDLFASQNDAVREVKEQLLEKEKELANLQKEHDALRLSHSNLEAEVTTFRQSSNSAEEIISNQSKDIADLKLKMAEFDQVQDLLTDSALKITELEEKMTTVANTEYELKHLRNEYATLETQRESALCALKEANLALEIKSKVEEQCAAYKARLDSACSQIQELENQVKGVEKLKSEVNELKLEKAEHANSIATLNKNLDDFKARYTSSMNEHQTVLKEKMEIGTQLAEAEYKLSGLQEKLISLENRHGQQVKENKELLAELQSLKAAVKDLESRAPVSQPNFDVEWVRQENARLTNHSSHLSEKLDSAIKETENLRRVIKESSSEKDVLLKETDQFRLKLQELETARNTDHVKEELMEKLEESQKELEEANAKVVNLTAQVNSLEDFLKKNEKRVEFATFSEYKAVKHCLGAIGKTEVILLERCMKKMEKELELLKVQKKELESKVMKNASIAEHYKSKVIEYRNKYYIEVGQPEKVVSLTTLHQPQLNAIQEESREESGRESVAEMQSTSKKVIPIEETKAVEKPIVKTEQSIKKIKIEEDIVPSKPAPPNNSAVEGKTAETEVPRIPLGKVNSPRKNSPSMRLETVPGTSASSAGRLPEPKSEKPGKVQPPVRGRVTRSTTRKLGDEDMPDNCKQQ